MEKLLLCRICLVDSVTVRMKAVVDRNMHTLYKMLTDVTFVTDDKRPMLACFFCYAKLKQCYQLQRKCLEAEQLLDLMINEPNSVINRRQLQFFNGYMKTPMENINIVGGIGQIESIPIKQELPTGCERRDDFIEQQEEHLSEDLKLENIDNDSLDVEDTPAQHSKSNSVDDGPLKNVTTEVHVEQQVFKRKRTAVNTKKQFVAKKQKIDVRRMKLEDTITVQQKKTEQPLSKNTIPSVKNSIKNTPVEITCCNNSNKGIDSNDMKVYLRPCIKEKPCKCEICQRSYAQKATLAHHIRVHIGEKPYKCDICQRRYSTKSVLTRHIRVHTGDKPYKCEICQRSFLEKDTLTNHIRVHTGDKPYKCDTCQRCFSVRSALTEHIRVHTGEKPYKCETCQRSFVQKVHLTRHIRVHTGENPYKCEICQRGFVQKIHLTRHIHVHTGENPYKCKICLRSFVQKVHLTRHIRVHTGEKPYKCEICQRSFARKNSLTKHICVHTRENPYK